MHNAAPAEEVDDWTKRYSPGVPPATAGLQLSTTRQEWTSPAKANSCGDKHLQLDPWDRLVRFPLGRFLITEASRKRTTGPPCETDDSLRGLDRRQNLVGDGIARGNSLAVLVVRNILKGQDAPRWPLSVTDPHMAPPPLQLVKIEASNLMPDHADGMGVAVACS